MVGMRRSRYLQGPAPEFRGVAFLGIFVLACTCYVACGGSDRSYGSGKPDSSNPANGGGAGGTSMTGSGGSGGRSGGGTGAGGVLGGGGGTGGLGRGGAGGVGTAGRGSGARDASDDGPVSNAN